MGYDPASHDSLKDRKCQDSHHAATQNLLLMGIAPASSGSHILPPSINYFGLRTSGGTRSYVFSYAFFGSLRTKKKMATGRRLMNKWIPGKFRSVPRCAAPRAETKMTLYQETKPVASTLIKNVMKLIG